MIGLASRGACQGRYAEWPDGLYTRFYEQPQYKRIRRILDYEVEPDLSSLRRDMESGAASDLDAFLVAYVKAQGFERLERMLAERREPSHQ